MASHFRYRSKGRARILMGEQSPVFGSINADLPPRHPTAQPANEGTGSGHDRQTRRRRDQHQRWQGGGRVAVETYLAQEPGLRSNPEALLDLLFREVLLREERGETPELSELL